MQSSLVGNFANISIENFVGQSLDKNGATMSDKGEGSKPVEKPSVREVNSDELFRGQIELLIRHGEELYRLKVTRNQKLILHK